MVGLSLAFYARRGRPLLGRSSTLMAVSAASFLTAAFLHTLRFVVGRSNFPCFIIEFSNAFMILGLFSFCLSPARLIVLHIQCQLKGTVAQNLRKRSVVRENQGESSKQKQKADKETDNKQSSKIRRWLSEKFLARLTLGVGLGSCIFYFFLVLGTSGFSSEKCFEGEFTYSTISKWDLTKFRV